MKKNLLRALGGAIVLLIVGVILYPLSATRGLVSYVSGHAGRCSFSDALGAWETRREQRRLFREIAGSSHLVTRTEDGFELWETPSGRLWTPQGTHEGLFYTLAEQEREVYGSGEHGVSPGDIVLDCGANIGVYTKKALAAGARLVVAIEPVPRNVECLRRNFKTEIETGKVIVYAKGLWDKEDTLTIFLHDNTVLDTFVMKDRSEQETTGQLLLPVTAIDQLVEELELKRVDFIKMDIEGAEQKALVGARQTLSTWRPRLAIATENLVEDQYRVPELVRRAWTGYEEALGPCTSLPYLNDIIQPEVLYFR